MSISPQCGAKRPGKLPCLKYYNVLKRENRLNWILNDFYLKLYTDCLMRLAENKMSSSHNFFPSVWHFLICFCDNTDVYLDGHHVSDSFILTIWTLSLCEVVKLKLMNSNYFSYLCFTNTKFFFKPLRNSSRTKFFFLINFLNFYFIEMWKTSTFGTHFHDTPCTKKQLHQMKMLWRRYLHFYAGFRILLLFVRM